MLRVLLAKDLRRAWRNPLPALINIALPLCITALIGLAFGGSSDNKLERIRFAVVDEDQALLANLLRSAMNQKQGGEHLDPVFVDRETALRQINDNEIGGALIIPTNFTHDYFGGRDTAKLELIKNPAQSIQPAALEELAGTAVAVLNALRRNFKAQFPDWHDAFDGDVDHRRLSTIIERVGDRFDSIKKYVDPPLVSYEKPDEANSNDSTNHFSLLPHKSAEKPSAPKPSTNSALVSPPPPTNSISAAVTPPASAPPPPPKPKSPSNFSKIFGWVLPAISAMFLLFLANNAMTDLYREMRFRTFERYQTLRVSLLPFVLSKVIYAMVFLLICGAIMLGGGGFIFRIEWQQPLGLAMLLICYGASAAGVMALFVALVPDERRAATLNSVVGMLLGFGGGCMFPARQLPQFIREHVTPYLPTYWFVETAHQLQDGSVVAWAPIALKMVLTGAALVLLAVAILQRRINQGIRA